MEQINDIFDITDENNDAFDYTKEELNRYFESGHLHSLIYEEEIIDDDFVNDLNNIQVKHFQSKYIFLYKTSCMFSVFI